MGSLSCRRWFQSVQKLLDAFVFSCYIASLCVAGWKVFWAVGTFHLQPLAYWLYILKRHAYLTWYAEDPYRSLHGFCYAKSSCTERFDLFEAQFAHVRCTA